MIWRGLTSRLVAVVARLNVLTSIMALGAFLARIGVLEQVIVVRVNHDEKKFKNANTG